MAKCESARLKFACVAPADMDRLYLINFPHQIGQLMKQTFRKHYLPGVASEAARDASAIHEIVLQGPPWSQNSSYNLHARSMLMMVIKDLSTFGWKLVASSDATAKYVHHVIDDFKIFGLGSFFSIKLIIFRLIGQWR